MKLASFVRNQQIDCGMVVDGGFKVFDAHPTLGAIASDQRLYMILGMSPVQRNVLRGEMAGAEVVSADQVKLLPAVPDPPMYMFAHGNCPTIWLRQLGNEPGKWRGYPQVPYPRVRPVTALCGDGAEVLVPSGARAIGGAELGIVIGREAHRVSRQEATEHIAGLVVLNDMNLIDMHEDFMTNGGSGGPGRFSGVDTASKCADGGAGLGPWVTTAEGLEAVDASELHPQAWQRYADRQLASWVYNRTILTHVGGKTADMAMANGYLWGAEDMIAYLSRFMRLRTGTVIGLAAPGWDGVWFDLADSPGATADIAVELSAAGAMRARLRRMQPEEEHTSPYLRAVEALGLRPPHEQGTRRTRSLWVLRGNHRTWDETQGLSLRPGIDPLLYPSQSLGQGVEPLLLPPHATTLRCSVHVAAVIGPTPVYRATRDSALSHLAGVVPLLSVRDMSLIEAVPNPTAYDRRGANYLSGCGDGFFRAGPLRPLSDVGNLRDQTMRLRAPGTGEMAWKTEDYLLALSDLVVFHSRITTLLPGDVLSLGAAGLEMEVSPLDRVESLEAACGWGVSFTVPVDDQRESCTTT
jgi:2-keto-4-pentenoate hydratase/2-oxohepta-3-ene-1,7-dioic acid hydratase in catechol pathway